MKWLDQAGDQLNAAKSGIQGEVLLQQAATALIQADREGASLEQSDRVLQGQKLMQLHQIITSLSRKL